MAGTLCQIARQIYRSLNSRKAKQRDTLDIAAIYSILQDLQSAKTVGQVYQFRIQLIYGENWPMYLRGIAHMSSFLGEHDRCLCSPPIGYLTKQSP